MTNIEIQLFQALTKKQLFEMAKHLAAASCEIGYEEAFDSNAWAARLIEEAEYVFPHNPQLHEEMRSYLK